LSTTKARRGGLHSKEVRDRGEANYALAILPALMQLEQTRSRLGAPFTSALTTCRFTFQRRRVMLCACEMLLPKRGPLPQMSQVCAMVQLQILECITAPEQQKLGAFLERTIS
jgi:hypothetical protein